MKSALNNQSLVIHGCGGHARSLADVALASGVTELVFVDENAKAGEQLFGFPVVSNAPSVVSGAHLVAMGDNHKRADVFQQLADAKINITSLISQSAYLGKEHTIGKNVFIGHRAHIGPRATIGDNTIINTHCIIEHDCRIGKHCHISVNAVVAGSCQIGDYVMVGAGATVIDGTKIASNITIGAGAVVVGDLTEPGVYVGIPARKR
jgi:sugar O-acyltransferase (sialic acid O-acetyltransferase NeuD family)